MKMEQGWACIVRIKKALANGIVSKCLIAKLIYIWHSICNVYFKNEGVVKKSSG